MSEIITRDEFDKVKKELKELGERTRKDIDEIKFHTTNIFVNVLMPITIFVIYIIIKKYFSIYFFNKYFDLDTTILMAASILSIALFLKSMIINAKMVMKIVFRTFFVK